MANGYISSLPLPFGIGVQPVEQVGKGGGPLPFMVGAQSGAVVVIGKGYGPLPFIMGLVSTSATRGGAGRRKKPLELDDFIAREDEEIIMILIALLEGLD